MLKTSSKINKKHIIELRKWFNEYVDLFINVDGVLPKNIALKKHHTKNVCKNIKNIAASLNLNESEINISEIIALFHDIGRFEQYRIYKTFSDAKSVNHAQLGVDILIKNNVFSKLERDLQELLLKTVEYHNQAIIPRHETDECIFFSKLIRDADKLDIFRVVTEYYLEREKGVINKSIELDLPDNQEISEKVVRQILSKSIVSIENIRTLNDFKLLQMGWIFDINFPHTFFEIKVKNYIETISRTLPQTNHTREIFDLIFCHLDEGCGKTAKS